MKRTSTYKDGHAPINLTRALCIITLLIDGARNLIRVTNRMHNLARESTNHIARLTNIANSNISADEMRTKFTAEATKYHNTVLYLPSPNANSKCNRIANDFSHEIDRITDILHDNSGYKWIDNTE